MKSVLIFVLLSIPVCLNAQNTYPLIKGSAVYFNQYDYYTMDTPVIIGKGTLPTGDYKYITTSVSRIPLDRKYAGTKAVITKVKDLGSDKRGHKYFFIVDGIGDYKFEIEIQNALESGEVVSKDPAIVSKLQTQTKPYSVADEILKLKKLMDDGLLTREEFDVQKKKLLSQ